MAWGEGVGVGELMRGGVTTRLCCATGPPGALLRWQLGSLNGALPGQAWLPAGTLAANLLACAIIFAVQVCHLPASVYVIKKSCGCLFLYIGFSPELKGLNLISP